MCFADLTQNRIKAWHYKTSRFTSSNILCLLFWLCCIHNCEPALLLLIWWVVSGTCMKNLKKSNVLFILIEPLWLTGYQNPRTVCVLLSIFLGYIYCCVLPRLICILLFISSRWRLGRRKEERREEEHQERTRKGERGFDITEEEPFVQQCWWNSQNEGQYWSIPLRLELQNVLNVWCNTNVLTCE